MPYAGFKNAKGYKMYLHLLSRKEQEYFLELAHYVANCDERYAGQEKMLINQYRKELEISVDDYKIQKKDIEEILKNLDNAKIKAKIAMFLEISVLVISDYEYHNLEHEVLTMLRDRWDISKEKFEAVLRWYKELQIIWKTEDKK